MCVECTSHELEAVREQLSDAVEALEFYANEKNYQDNDNSCRDLDCCGGPWPSYAVVNDEGWRARKALKMVRQAKED